MRSLQDRGKDERLYFPLQWPGHAYPNWLQRADVVRPKEWFENVVRQMISLDALIFLFVLTNIHAR